MFSLRSIPSYRYKDIFYKVFVISQCIYNNCVIFTGTSNSIQLKEKHGILYNDLITIMTDHQNVLK